jgi:hypothetical protein
MDLYFISFFALFTLLALALLVVTFNFTKKLLGWFNRHPTAFGFISLGVGASILFILFNWQFSQIKTQELYNLPNQLLGELGMNNKTIHNYCKALKTYDNSGSGEGDKYPVWQGYRYKVLQNNKDLIVQFNPKNGGLWVQTAKQMEPFNAPQSTPFSENQQKFLCQAMQGRHKFLISQFSQ